MRIRQTLAWVEGWLEGTVEWCAPEHDVAPMNTVSRFVVWVMQWACAVARQPVGQEMELTFQTSVARVCRSFELHAGSASVPTMTARKRARRRMATDAQTVSWIKFMRKARSGKLFPKALPAPPAVAEDAWQRQWTSPGNKWADGGECICISAQVGPQGLEASAGALPAMIASQPHKPMAIMLQDIRATRRRMRGLEQRLRTLCPDYTVFFTIRPPTVARRYNMGVATLVRNDVALKATKADVPAMIDWESYGQLPEHHRDAVHGRLLLVKTKPAGAAGPVWLLNVYQHADAGAREAKRQVYFVCTAIAQCAADEGAALLMVGDWNATLDEGQRPSGTRGVKTADKDFREFAQRVGVRPAHGLVHDEVSWESTGNIRHRADIDHLLALPSSVAMSARRFARPLNCSNDHQPIVVTLDHAVFGSPIPALMDPAPNEMPEDRINVVELEAHRHNVVSALQGWWGDRIEKDPASLHGHLQQARRIMGTIVGVVGKALGGKSCENLSSSQVMPSSNGRSTRCTTYEKQHATARRAARMLRGMMLPLTSSSTTGSAVR